MTAGNKRKIPVPVFMHRPGPQRLAKTYSTLYPCSLHPSGSFGTSSRVVVRPCCSSDDEDSSSSQAAGVHEGMRDDSNMSHLVRAQRGNSTCRVISALAAGLRTFFPRRKVRKKPLERLTLTPRNADEAEEPCPGRNP